MRKANVKSIDVIPEFRAALIVFQNRVLDSLSTMQEEVFRALDYVENDRPRHWQQQVLDAFPRILDVVIQHRCVRFQSYLVSSSGDLEPILGIRLGPEHFTLHTIAENLCAPTRNRRNTSFLKLEHHIAH